MSGGSPPVGSARGTERTVPARLGWGGILHGLWLFTWKGQTAIRRLPVLALVLLAVPLLAGLTTGPAEDGSPARQAYFQWTLNFYLLLLVPLYCLVTCGGMIRDELQADTLSYWTTRPVSRARLLLGRFVCQAGWLEIVAGVNGLLLLAVGWWRGIPGVIELAPIFLGVQALAVLVFGALSTLLGLAARRYLVLGIIYGAVIEVGIGRIPTNINNLSMTRHLQTLLARHPEVAALYPWSSDGSGRALLFLVLAGAVFIAAAALLFTFKEFNQSEEMQK